MKKKGEVGRGYRERICALQKRALGGKSHLTMCIKSTSPATAVGVRRVGGGRVKARTVKILFRAGRKGESRNGRSGVKLKEAKFFSATMGIRRREGSVWYSRRVRLIHLMAAGNVKGGVGSDPKGSSVRR